MGLCTAHGNENNLDSEDSSVSSDIDSLQVEVQSEGIELEASCIHQQRSVGDSVYDREYSANRMFTYS